MKSWPEEALEKAQKLIAEEPDLLKQTYSPDFVDFCKLTGLFFSFGDITWLIQSSMKYNIEHRFHGSGAGIACFEDLVKRFKLYLIQELKAVINGEGPYRNPGRVYGTHSVDYNFVSDFLDLFKLLDQLSAMVKEIHVKEEVITGE